MTVEQKIKALHDYVCSITSYDLTLQKNSAYTALINGQTMYRGYALLLYKLYGKIGIPTHIVVGTVNGVSHAWNMVQVDGKWYHIDATTLVIIAEASMLLVDINSAQTLVNSLPTGAGKTALISRLDIVKKYLTSTNLVITAEKTISQATVDTANKSINSLIDGSVKTSLK